MRDTSLHYKLPSKQAQDIRDQLRVRHADCDALACALRSVWAEDIQEVLDLLPATDGSP